MLWRWQYERLLMNPREFLLAWAKSEGFAALHNGAATDEQIVDDLLKWLDEHGLVIVDGEDLLPGSMRNPIR